MVLKRLKLVSIAVSKGVVTRKYPLEPPMKSPRFRGAPTIDPALCIGCGACAQACPTLTLTAEFTPDGRYREIKVFYGRCIFCGRCEEACPTGALKLSEEFELATDNKEDLYYIVAHEVVKCSVCGKPFTTVRMLKWVQESLKELNSPTTGKIEKLLTICPECRRKLAVLEEVKSRFGGGASE